MPDPTPQDPRERPKEKRKPKWVKDGGQIGQREPGFPRPLSGGPIKMAEPMGGNPCIDHPGFNVYSDGSTYCWTCDPDAR